jgi:hypothetical protein
MKIEYEMLVGGLWLDVTATIAVSAANMPQWDSVTVTEVRLHDSKQNIAGLLSYLHIDAIADTISTEWRFRDAEAYLAGANSAPVGVDVPLQVRRPDLFEPIVSDYA